MTRASSSEIVEPFSEPEREFHRRRIEGQVAQGEELPPIQEGEPVNSESETEEIHYDMADPNDLPMWETRLTAPAGPPPAIRVPPITADNFEIKGQFLSMLRENQFDGRMVSDPITHVENFLDTCELFKNQGASDDAVRLRVFLLTLTGDAKGWLKSLGSGTITTWNSLRDKFITRYFPPAKAEKLCTDITTFKQKIDESLYEA